MPRSKPTLINDIGPKTGTKLSVSAMASNSPDIDLPVPASAPEPEFWEQPDPTTEPFADGPAPRRRLAPVARFVGGLIVVGALFAASFEFVYADRIFPGITANGVYIGGLSRAEAAKRITDKTTTFAGSVVTISYNDTNLRVPISTLQVKYDPATAAQQAFTYGRQGDFWSQAIQQARALFGRHTAFSSLTFDSNRLTPYVNQLADDLITPVQNATLSFDDNHASVTPAASGTRLDLGRLIQLVVAGLDHTSTDPIAAPVYQLQPDLATDPLQAAIGQINTYIAGPITLNSSTGQKTIDQSVIISWMQIGTKPSHDFLNSLSLPDLYPPPPAVKLGLDPAAVKTYAARLAADLDQTPQNASLAMQDGQLAIVEPSRSGIKLNQADTVTAITAALSKPADQRTIDLKLDTAPADVNEATLDSLGIKDQISEGETYFPGSTSARLTNVRAGARRFNGVLLKPGEEFSFGKLLGDVGPETGYVPELVILADHEEKQYGGGLCQVSSTAFRAALGAGLPITERHNHSFAISYYTWPYAAPGVDATIYYPALDFKFVNDTGHYLLIQTTMKGTDLKFDFFGTKTKSGRINPPTFISGSNDATKPSKTVFTRDILDLAGNVTKTDTFYTTYKPSTDFPVTQQFN